MNDTSKDIIRSLSKCLHTGRRQHEVFRDFVCLTEQTLRMMPAHAASARKTGQMAEDDAEAAAVWEQMRRHYKRPEFDRFAEAFQILLASTDEYHDAIGNTYMNFAYPNPGAGQFFTPFDLAAAMARMTWGEGELIYERLNDASKAAGLDALITFSPQTPHAAEYFLTRFVEAIGPHFRPITVQDPCCGSGVMFLASASVLPPWATRYGLVQFYGQDTDMLCCQMAKVNLMLYGLNGFSIKCAVACTEGTLLSSGGTTKKGVDHDLLTNGEREDAVSSRSTIVAREVRTTKMGQCLLEL